MKEYIPFMAATLAMTSAPALAGSTTLFHQPSYMDGAAAHFSVTGQVPAYNPTNTWYVHANEPQTYVPVPWSAAQYTGLSVPADTQDWQMGVNAPGHSVAQVYGTAVGAYINSVDLAGQPPLQGFDYSMMIAPEIFWSAGPRVFSSATGQLEISFDEQAPTATHGTAQGTNAFTKFDVLLVDPNNTRLSISYGTFVSVYPKSDNVGYDPVSNTVIIAASLVFNPVPGVLGQFATLRPNSVQIQTAPWTGWRHFHFTTSQAQFITALQQAAPMAQSLGKSFSLNPADWVLSSSHLNAELHYTPTQPSTLGWSLQNVAIRYQ